MYHRTTYSCLLKIKHSTNHIQSVYCVVCLMDMNMEITNTNIQNHVYTSVMVCNDSICTGNGIRN